MSAKDLLGVAPVLRDELADLELADIIPANSITNAELAADVKVGSLATLTTTAKSSLTAAINEVAATAQTALARVAAAQADSTAATIDALVTDFNDLLANLRTAGLLASE